MIRITLALSLLAYSLMVNMEVSIEYRNFKEQEAIHGWRFRGPTEGEEW